VSGRAPREPRDYRRIVDLVGGAVISVVALLVALGALVVALFSHEVLTGACSRATGPTSCNGPLLTGGYVFTVVGVAAALVAVIGLQLRAVRRDDGLWTWPLLGIAVICAVVLLGVLLMRTAHPASVGALGPGTVSP